MPEPASLPVSLIIPALNEAQSLPLLAPRIPTWVDEVIVVDNASSDATGRVATDLGFRCVYEAQRGYGAAAWAGAQAATGQIFAFAAADGSDPVDLLGQILAPIRAGQAAFVLSARQPAPGALTLAQRWGNALACALIRLRWGVKFMDLGAFRALRRDTFAALAMADRGFGWTFEMQAKVAARGVPWRHVPLPYGVRQAGAAKISGTLGGTLRASWAILATFIVLAFRRQI